MAAPPSGVSGPLPRGDLRLRVVSSLVMIPAALAVVFAGGWAFDLMVALLAVVMALEWGALVAGGKRRVGQALVMVFTLAAIGSTLVWSESAGVVAAGIGSVTAACCGRGLGVERAVWLMVAVLAIAVPSIAIIWSRHLEPLGLETVLWSLSTVVATDIGAYAAGKTIGGPKLMPSVSPAKTWAGLFGGMAAAVAVSVITWALSEEVSLAILCAVAVFVAVIGQAGDLLESSMKRRFMVKDSGRLIPGHGGILDRLDGHLAVQPVVALAVAVTGGSMLAW